MARRTTTRGPAATIRAILRKLKPTGAEGFEGLIATVLTEITGTQFRLAGSGSQFGVDGRAAYELDGIAFEGKRYDGDIPRSEVLTKIMDLAISDDGEIDLWILAATTPVKAQLASDVRRAAEEHGIATLILDWSATGMPPLAVALALGAASAEQFLAANLKSQADVSAAGRALQALLGEQGFRDHAARLRAELEQPTIGAELAQRANVEWLQRTFSSREVAKRFFGQPLAPGDSRAGAVSARRELVGQLGTLMAAKPDGRTVVVLGEEGNGKSWLVASSWLALIDKPLMAVFTADDFVNTHAGGDLVDALIGKLVAQTGGRRSPAVDKRWRRRLTRWSSAPTPIAPRLLVVIDGLNQRPGIDWGRLIEAFGGQLSQIGGVLLITTRTAYYEAAIRRRVSSGVTEVRVAGWTTAERDAILVQQGIRPADLRESVASSLLNPRLLGIALELLQASDIQTLEQLNVGRLWFEHMRAQERDAASPRPAFEFARTLRTHAEEILKHAGAQHLEEINVFEGGVEAVADGRFFVPLSDDPSRYRIDVNGLPIAMGFAILDQLRSARRGGHDLASVLDSKVEPVRALDMTAHVILAALTIACLDVSVPGELGAAILKAFTQLQNPDEKEFPAFAALARRRPRVFIQVAHDLSLADEHAPNFDWVEAGLHQAKNDDGVWVTVVTALQDWLSYFSLAPERSMHLHPVRDPKEKVEEERVRRKQEIDARLDSLSERETSFLGTLLRRDDGDLSRLARLALRIAAGKPLAPLVPALARWTFSSALNSDHRAPYPEFTHLVRFNRHDWVEARSEILRACRVFDWPEVSRTGKWALVNLLESTGETEDAIRAKQVREPLVAARDRPRSWRLVENYCATDPCDPKSTKPDNVRGTSERYAAIDVTKLRLGLSQANEDHFFSMARPGMARFEPGVCIRKHRELIVHVGCRSGLPLRQGLFETHDHNALVRAENATSLLARRKAVALGEAGDFAENDAWIVGQYCLLLSFPLLSAEEQIRELLCRNAGEVILLDLMDVLKPLDALTFEELLEGACRNGDDRAQFIALAFAANSRTPISSGARKHVAALVRSPVEKVRTAALGLVAASKDVELNHAVIDSGWKAPATEAEHQTHESWYGSSVLLDSAERGLLGHAAAFERLAPQLFGRAATKLAPEVVRAIAQRIHTSICCAAGLSIDIAVPEIEMREHGDVASPMIYSMSERPRRVNDPAEAFKRMFESNEAREQRQERLLQAFNTFRAQLTQSKAEIILNRFQLAEFDAIAASDRNLAERWYQLFIDLPAGRRAGIHNLGLLLAHALAQWDAKKALHLFRILESDFAVVRTTEGHAAIPLSIIAPWSAQGDAELDDLRRARLDRAATDYEIGMEVIGALRVKKQLALERYVEARSESGHPAAIARALMVAGLSDSNPFNDRMLARFESSAGFIGRTRKAALYAYERNAWAHHWYSEMIRTQDRDEFWRCSVLFSKVVDGRFDIWDLSIQEPGEPFRLFWPSVEDQLRYRFERWQNLRRKKLFGQDAPAKLFLDAVG